MDIVIAVSRLQLSYRRPLTLRPFMGLRAILVKEAQ
ncbi:hypothetical protein CCACVL1_00109, partial [Corchorus capsularis]